MPLPLIPLLLGGAAVVGGALGVGGALSGKEKLDQAKKRIDAAREEYEKKKRKAEPHRENPGQIGETEAGDPEELSAFCRRL